MMAGCDVVTYSLFTCCGHTFPCCQWWERLVCECWPLLFVFILSMKCVFGVNSGSSFSAFHLWAVKRLLSGLQLKVNAGTRWKQPRIEPVQTGVRVEVWVHCDGNAAWGVFWGACPRPLQPVCWSSWRPAPHSNGHLLIWTWLLHVSVLNKMSDFYSRHLIKNVFVCSLWGLLHLEIFIAMFMTC